MSQILMMDLQEYQKYFSSHKWRNIRRGHLKKKNKCAFCKGTNELEVHHKDYKYFKNERAEPNCLQTLCNSCHKALHKQLRKHHEIQKISQHREFIQTEISG